MFRLLKCFRRGIAISLVPACATLSAGAVKGHRTGPATIDFGIRLPNQMMTYNATVFNPLPVPVQLAKLRTSCGCLSGTVNPKIIAPRGSAGLTLRVMAHATSGPAAVSALLEGNAGKRKLVWSYVVRYRVRQMLDVISPGDHAAPNGVDIGRLASSALSRPESFIVQRGGFPAKWDTLGCTTMGRDLNVSLHQVTPNRWIVRLLFADTNVIGPQSFGIRFSFMYHGKELSYHFTEPIDVNITGPVSLVPQSLFMGVVKPGHTLRRTVSLWTNGSRSDAWIASAVSDDPAHFRIRLTEGGKKAIASFRPGSLRGRVGGVADLIISFKGTRYRACESYLAYVTNHAAKADTASSRTLRKKEGP